MQHPLLILVRGLPGSGKSYLAVELKKRFGEDATVSLDPDTIDFDTEQYKEHVTALTAEGVDEALYPYRFLRAQAYQGISDHKVIIWNQPFTNLEIFKKMIERLETHAAEQNTSLPILVVEVEVDPAVAKDRVVKRKNDGGHGPSDDTFERFLREYTSYVHEGYDVVTVQGENTIADSVQSVLDRAATLIHA